MNVREVIKLIEDDGWFFVRQTGSHRVFRHVVKPGTTTVAGNLGNGNQTRHPGEHLATGWAEEAAMTGYAIIIEGEGDSFSAYAPELPGCIATGNSVAEVEALMRKAIELHLEVMREYGDEIPPPTTVATAIAEVVTAK